MAAVGDRVITLSASLCFIFAKYRKLDEKRLKITVLDFYQSNDISSTMKLLANDVQKLNLGKTPKMTERRGEHRTVKEVDDILS